MVLRELFREEVLGANAKVRFRKMAQAKICPGLMNTNKEPVAFNASIKRVIHGGPVNESLFKHVRD